MGDWSALRTVAVVLAWLAVLGGVTMATVWIAGGGLRAYGPEDEDLASGGVLIPEKRRRTSFGSAQVGVHGLLGILTAALLTFAATRAGDRAPGYLAVIVAVLVTSAPGVAMFQKWRARRRASPGRHDQRVEDRIPAAAAYTHGLFVVLTAVLVLILVFVD